MVQTLRLAVATAVLVLLGRAARVAWPNRRLAYVVWRRIRPRHVLGSIALLAAVLTVALGLLQLVPITRIGLGSLIGLGTNAVFAPLEEVSMRTRGTGLGGATTGAGAPEGATSLLLLLGVAVFLIGLLLLFPWLAYVEERTFREGLENAGLLGEVVAALRFGLVHLVMLIPLAAALAISVAGFTYGRLYLRAHRRASARQVVVEGPAGTASIPVSPARARAEAVLESTVWHATFNSLIVLAVLAGFVLEAVLR